MSIPDVWPEGCKVLIEVDTVEAATSGGIFLPQSVRQAEQLKLTVGTVLRLGSDADIRLGPDRVCKEGTRIIFAKYGGFRLQDMDRKRDFRLINDDDVLAVIGDEGIDAIG